MARRQLDDQIRPSSMSATEVSKENPGRRRTGALSDQRLRGLISPSGTAKTKPPRRGPLGVSRFTFHQPGPSNDGPTISPAHDAATSWRLLQTGRPRLTVATVTRSPGF